MRGSITKRALKSGRSVWRVQLDAGRDDQGKRVRVSKDFQLKREAEAELERMLQERADDRLLKPSPRTFAGFLDEWLVEHADRNCTPKTVERYRQLAQYVLPHVGQVPLKDLAPRTLERLYGRLRDGGGKGGRPLSARTVRHVAGLVHVALQTGVRWKLLRFNPADAVILPPIEHREAKAADRAEIQLLLDGARGHWVYPIIAVAVATGCRRGEILALQWSDIEFEQRFVTIAKSLEQTKAGLRIKTPKNRRTRRFPLPGSVLDALRSHRQEQQQARELFGADYRADLDLVFATPEGEYLKPDSITAKVCQLAKDLGLKGVSLHALRHSHASQLLAAGVPLPTVSKRLGHSSVNVTGAIYSHSFAADEVAAADAWERSMGDALHDKLTTQ